MMCDEPVLHVAICTVLVIGSCSGSNFGSNFHSNSSRLGLGRKRPELDAHPAVTRLVGPAMKAAMAPLACVRSVLILGCTKKRPAEPFCGKRGCIKYGLRSWFPRETQSKTYEHISLRHPSKPPFLRVLVRQLLPAVASCCQLLLPAVAASRAAVRAALASHSTRHQSAHS